MYPCIYCETCGRNLSMEREVIEQHKQKIAHEIEKCDEYQLFGTTLNFPMRELIEKMHLNYCCTTMIITKRD